MKGLGMFGKELRKPWKPIRVPDAPENLQQKALYICSLEGLLKYPEL